MKKHNVIPSAAWESIKQTLFYRINFIYGSSRELAFAQDDIEPLMGFIQ